MKNLLDYVRARTEPPQSLPIPGTTQVLNSAGGYAWAVDDWMRLDRFLILGAESGTYYVTEPKLTRENAEAVLRCIADDGTATVARIVALSESGRAPKNDPALFALALCATDGNEATKHAAFAALPRVCRTGTHLFHFTAFVDGMRGWGRGLRQAVAAWYAMPADKLAYQVVKYQQRDGWSHRDLLRLAHPKPADDQHAAIYYWLTKGWEGVGEAPHPDAALRVLWAFERAKRATSAAEIVALITDHRLPREAIPTRWLNDPAVWAALLPGMPLEALVRNLATLTRLGLIAPLSDGTRHVVAQLGNVERIHAARLHPIKLLAALKTYAGGRGARGQHTWQPVVPVVDALDAAFYASFGTITPTGRRWVLALDVSGSMGGSMIAGVPGLDARVGSAAMALVTAATEAQHTIIAFSAGANGYGGQWSAGESGITEVAISPRQRLDDVVRTTEAIPMGGTDCALPMIWAVRHKVAADVFVIYTDSETWAGAVHPAQALRRYRQKMGIAAQLIVVGMTSTGFTIADPDDAGMLDVVGFDTAAPQVMSNFVTG
ncbi:MAG TPA: TROVE domain-containing protein [Chloroflexia bacterium]|nr:TROVE domain-containing protein [Chloroflexia bacterium]